MFKPETKILFQEATAGTRLLLSATVVESCEDSFTVEFDSEEIDSEEIDSEKIELDEGQELIAYFHGSPEFMQQLVRVVELIDRAGKLVIDLAPVGDAVSAEFRQYSRAIAISANLFAVLGEDRDLTVQDVSPTGFAVVSKVEYSIGATLDVSLTFDGDIYSGTALVQSIREFSSGRIRYGLRVLEQGDLQDGLQQISLAVQRQQLRRK